MLGNDVGLHLCGTAADGRTKIAEVRPLPETTVNRVAIADIQGALRPLLAGGVLLHASLILRTAVLDRQRQTHGVVRVQCRYRHTPR